MSAIDRRPNGLRPIRDPMGTDVAAVDTTVPPYRPANGVLGQRIWIVRVGGCSSAGQRAI